MTETDSTLLLTFAEIEFLLRVREPALCDLRATLGIDQFGTGDDVARAGSASLVARGLCTFDGADLIPSAEVVVVIAGLSDAANTTRAVGWIAGGMTLVHLLTGPDVCLALFAASQGQFVVHVLDPSVTVADQVTRFVDSCLATPTKSAVVIQSRTAEETVGLAVARDDAGAWFLSDSEGQPDAATPTTRDDVVARIGELLPAGAR